MKQLLARSSTRIWLAIVGTATLLLMGSYTMVQQSTRLAADDLPLAKAQTLQHDLNSGSAPTDAVPAVKIDLKSDVSPFYIVTDESQNILASSAQLDGKTPLPPKGVFSFTKEHGTDRFTWQPKNGVRLATRVVTYKNNSSSGFIITGQSLKQAEERIGTYGQLALTTWLAIIAWTVFFVIMPERNKLKTTTKK